MSNYKAYLRKQPTYDEITGYIHFGQDRITYPDRSTTFMRDSPYLGIYDGITFRELEDQEQKIETEKLKEAPAPTASKATHASPVSYATTTDLLLLLPTHIATTNNTHTPDAPLRHLTHPTT
jgi:hypothetical protein